MLKVTDLEASYGDLQVLWGVNLEVKKGEITALLGSNGAGKSTTLNTIQGLIRPKKGEIYLEGHSLLEVPAHKRISYGIVLVPEGRRLFPRMTVEDNLIMGSLYGKAREKRQEQLSRVYEIFPKLKERHKQLAGTLSGGEQQMLAIGRGLMSDPNYMLLDEPSLGLAPIVVRYIFELIQVLNSGGINFFLVEQNAMQALRISNRAYVMENGRINLEGVGKELLDNPRIKEAYLGL